MNVFELFRKRKNIDEWISKGLYSTYEKAQQSFIYKDGKFKIVERVVKDNID